jgi:hypothetical protein
MCVKHLVIVAIFMFLLSCTIADEDRCESGYTWDSKVKSCRKNPDTDVETDSATNTDLDSGAATDDGGPGTDQDTGPAGLGEVCTKDGNECAGYDIANYCAYDPTNPTASGICTIQNCSPGDCPAQYQCCNCMDIVITCVPPDGVESAIQKGCTCS